MMRAKLRRVGVMSCKGGAAARFGFDCKRQTFSLPFAFLASTELASGQVHVRIR